MMPWILISVLILVVLLAIIAIWVSRKHHRPPDYYNFFIMGVIWAGAGIPLKNYALSAMGIIFMIIGLTHKKDWKKNRVRWNDLNDSEKKARYWIIAIMGLLVLAGLAVMLLYR